MSKDRWADSLGKYPTPLDEIDRRASDNWDFPAYFQIIEQNAHALLADPRLAEATDILRDCRFALALLIKLSAAVENGDVCAATEIGFRLGAIDQRMTMRVLYDSHIRQARESQRGLVFGRRKKESKTQQRHKEIADAVKSRMQAHPRDSLTYARGIVAEQLGISIRTVRTATIGLKKPRKKIKK